MLLKKYVYWLFVICFVVLVLYINFNNKSSPEDIFENRLVYSRADSSLFTGTIIERKSSSIVSISYKNGLPFGKSTERQLGFRGPYVSIGVFYDIRELLSKNIISELGSDTAWLYYGHEGEDDEKNIYRLSIMVLWNKEISNMKILNDKNAFQKIAKEIYNETNQLSYKFLNIIFVNSICDGKILFYKEFKILGESLIDVK